MSEERLAIHGGKPAKERPSAGIVFPGGEEIGREEEEAVLEVIRSKRLFRYYGPSMGYEREGASKVEQFERAFAEKMGARYALGVNSGTSALHTGLVALGVGPGDEVIVPGYTFIASTVSIIAAGAVPVIAEVDDSLTLDPSDVEAQITRYTKAIMPVHMRGHPCDMEAIMRIAQEHDLRVIEDVAQSAGGTFKGKRLGSFGDVGCFSLQYHKIITTGEGGVVLTDDPHLYDRARMFHDTAACWRSERFASDEGGETVAPFVPGLNYRMSELIGAVALVQVGRLDELLARMRANKRRIMEGIANLEGVKVRRCNDPEGDTGVCLMIFVEDGDTAKSVAEALRAENISAGTWYDEGVPDWHVYAHWDHILDKVTYVPQVSPWHSPYYEGKVEYSKDMCPRTLDLLGRVIEIGVDPRWTDEEVGQVVTGIRKVARTLL